MKPTAPKMDIHTDFSQFQELKTLAREGNDGALDKVAKQFEAYFIKMLLKDLHATGFGGEDYGAQERETVQNMFNDQLSIHLSHGNGIGIADLIKRQVLEYTKIIRNNKTNDFSLPDLPTETQSPSEFVHSIGRLIKRELTAEGQMDQANLAKTILAQAILETGWGKHVLRHKDGRSSYNLFNIKSGASWNGDKITVPTLEYIDGQAVKSKETFRSYDSLQSSIRDYVKLINSASRYATARNSIDSPSDYLNALQDSGYASDPNYAQKVLQIMEQI